MPTLKVIVASVRQKRSGLSIAAWFVALAARHKGFEVQMIDLKRLDLPVATGGDDARMAEHSAVKQWTEVVRTADAFVFVTPEYNHAAPPGLLNALSFAEPHWQYKPAGFVSYGGFGGTRGVVMAKEVLASLRMVPLVEAVAIPQHTRLITDGAFDGGESHERAANRMLDELRRWAGALRLLRH